ncbi:MAG: restriction endonuclease subunit S [Pseudobacter sp.]|uniref:restriction endonuclease subunit S n=1 Tax=Pseudobacter sp. TaxID=2045420 RepID=UPI003F8151F1
MKKNEMKRYDAYKPSGVEWLGEIPEHWEVKRIKFLFEEINERSFNGEEDLLSVSQYTGVTKKSDEISESDLITNAITLEGYKKVAVNDLVSNIMLAWNGSLGFSSYDGITSPAYSVYRLNGFNKVRYFHYLLRTELYKAEYKKRSSGVIESRLRLYTENFFDISAILPPHLEQAAISQFLDTKTALIDKAIALKEKQIELLKERRQAIIHQAITKGLDPDVQMKDSGTEWIGMIPIHWEIQTIKHSLYGIVDCEHKTAPFIDEQLYFVVRTSNVKDGALIYDDAKYTNEKGYRQWTRRGVPQADDILLTREAPAGEACLIPENINICLGQRMVWLKINKTKIIPKFLIYLIYSSLVRSYIDYLSAGTTVLHLNISDIKNIPILSMPLEEQQKIIDFLNKSTFIIDSTIVKEKSQIEKLKEYKASLINSAVTGKIKVF